MREHRRGRFTKAQLAKNQLRLDHLQALKEAKTKKLSKEKKAMLSQGSLGGVGEALNFTLPSETSDVLVSLTGVFTATCVFEIAPDGQNFVGVQATNINTGAVAVNMTTTGVFKVTGLTGGAARVRMSARTSGAAAVAVQVSREL